MVAFSSNDDYRLNVDYFLTIGSFSSTGDAGYVLPGGGFSYVAKSNFLMYYFLRKVLILSSYLTL